MVPPRCLRGAPPMVSSTTSRRKPAPTRLPTVRVPLARPSSPHGPSATPGPLTHPRPAVRLPLAQTPSLPSAFEIRLAGNRVVFDANATVWAAIVIAVMVQWELYFV